MTITHSSFLGSLTYNIHLASSVCQPGQQVVSFIPEAEW